MTRKRENLILYLSFFLSGIAGLMYEILWAKHLILMLGSTTYAHTLILTIFMGGLALGSFLLGDLADKVKDKLLLYFQIEIGIALFCVLTPRLLKLSKIIYLIGLESFSLNPAVIVIIKFIIGALIILLPTILMGGTLPILSKYMIRSLLVSGQTVARLYYINNFGAIFGILLAGFYLICHFGLNLPIYIAALLNVAAGIMVLFLKKKDSIKNKEVSFEKEELKHYKESIFAKRIIKVSLWGIFISGFVAMLYEVVWIRLLSLVLGSSTYSFSLMLAAFISGITLGSFLISKFSFNEEFSFLLFGLCQIGIAIALIFSLPFYERLPFLFLKLSIIFSRTPENFIFYESAKFLLCFLVMLPPTVFLGMTFPLVSKIASKKLEFLGRKVGGVFASNSMGNILGASLTGLVLIPALGLKQTLEWGIIINLLLGFSVLLLDKTFSKKSKLIFVTLCGLIFIGYKIIIPEWNKVYFTAQVFRYREEQKVKESFSKFSKRIKETKDVLFYKDGLNGTVAVTKDQSGTLALFINGKADASTGGDMPTQILSGELPLILKPGAKDVLVVGLGSGVTCGSSLLHPIESLDLVEISSEVVEANRYFVEFNYAALKDKRLHLFIEDAKTFLQRTNKKYDVIISEPSNPWMSGLGNLFSKEYFSDCLKHLNKGGLMVQWIQAYEMDDETFKVILKTFSSVFSEVTLWNSGTNDIILMGSNEKMTLDFLESENKITQKTIREDLARIKIQDLFSLLTLQLASPKSLRDSVIEEKVVNSDYFPILEYSSPIALYAKSFVKDLLINMDERLLLMEKNELLIKNYLCSHTIDYDNLKNLFGYISENQSIYNRNLLFSLIEKWYRDYPDDKEAILAYSAYNLGSLDIALMVLEKSIPKETSFEYLDRYASVLVERYFSLRSFLLPEILTETVDKLKMCVNLSKEGKAKFYSYLGEVYLENKDYASAIIYYTKAEDLVMTKEYARLQNLDYVMLISNLSLAYYREGNFAKASKYAKRVLSFDEENPSAKQIINLIKSRTK